MAQTVVRAISVRRPYDEVAAFVTDPHCVLAAIPGFARFAFIGDAPGVPGGEHWDVFLEVGTFHVGGRVVVTKPSVNRLEWYSVRGTHQELSLVVEPLGDRARLTMTLRYALQGLVVSRVSELIAKGLVTRHVEAGLQQVRHQLEFGDFEVEPGRKRPSRRTGSLDD